MSLGLQGFHFVVENTRQLNLFQVLQTNNHFTEYVTKGIVILTLHWFGYISFFICL